MPNFTRRAIMESFKKLLNQRPLDKITVKDIVDDCGINRNTFYYHFQDIYALLDEIIHEETGHVTESDKFYESWQEGVLDSMDFVLQNKKAIHHIYGSISRDKLEPYLYQVIDKVLVSFVKEQARGLKVKEEDICIISDFYKYALVGFVLEWIRTGMKEDPKYFINRLGTLLDGNIKAMLTKVDSEN